MHFTIILAGAASISSLVLGLHEAQAAKPDEGTRVVCERNKEAVGRLSRETCRKVKVQPTNSTSSSPAPIEAPSGASQGTTTPAPAEQPQALSRLAASSEKKGSKERKICKSDVAIGSKMPRRTCLTAEQWRVELLSTQQKLRLWKGE